MTQSENFSMGANCEHCNLPANIGLHGIFDNKVLSLYLCKDCYCAKYAQKGSLEKRSDPSAEEAEAT
jgi:protein-arginine kinase activator protein McsA